MKRKSALALIITGIFIASNIYTMIPLQTLISQLFHISLSQVSLTSFFFIFPYAIGLFFFGILADRYPHRTILLTGMLLLSLTTLSLGFIHSFFLLISLRALQGFLAASFAPTAFAYSFVHFSGKAQSLVIAMINTGFLFAGVFGQILSAFIVKHLSFYAVFFTFTILYLSCYIFLSMTIEKTKPNLVLKQNLLYPIVTFLKNQTLRLLYGISFFLLFTIIIFYGSFDLFVHQVWTSFPFSLQAFRFLSLLGIIPAFFTGYLQQKFKTENLLLAALLLMAVGFLFPTVHLNISTTSLASLCMIASTSLSIPMVILLVGKYGAPYRASAVSIYSCILLIGASIASTLAPLIPFRSLLIGIVLIFFGLSFLVIRFIQYEIH